MRLNPHAIKFLPISISLLTCGCTTSTPSKYINEISEKPNETRVLESTANRKLIETKINNKEIATDIIRATKIHSDFSIRNVTFKLKNKNEWWLYRVEMKNEYIGEASIAPIESEPSVRIFTEIHSPSSNPPSHNQSLE